MFQAQEGLLYRFWPSRNGRGHCSPYNRIPLEHCRLRNPGQPRQRAGPGPRYLLGDDPIALSVFPDCHRRLRRAFGPAFCLAWGGVARG